MGNPRKGAAHETRKRIWEQLQQDMNVMDAVPRGVLDAQPDDFVDDLKSQSQGRRAWKK